MHHGGEAVAPCLRQLASGPSDHHYLIPTKHDSSFRRNMVISSRVRLYCLALTEAIRLTANIMVQTEVVDQGRPPVAIWPAVSAPPLVLSLIRCCIAGEIRRDRIWRVTSSGLQKW